MLNYTAGNMIYVSMQYRLGIFGFLAGSEVMQNGVANAGLLDQRAALDWIQRNIGYFGRLSGLLLLQYAENVQAAILLRLPYGAVLLAEEV